MRQNSTPPAFRILGPLEVSIGGNLVNLGAARQRRVLGLLLLNAGRLTQWDKIFDVVWYGSEPSRTARNAIQVCISNLRGILGDAAPITTLDDGYRLTVELDFIDLYRFRSLVRDTAGLLAPRRATQLRQAEALWRGPLLAGTFTSSLRQDLYSGVDEERLCATEERLSAELEVGQHSQLTGELTTLVKEHPARERLIGYLMLALYRDGQAPRALEVYRQARETLAEEIGIDPGPDLKALQSAILSQDPALHLHQSPYLVPAELPMAVSGFAGRETEIAILDEARMNQAAPVVVISGMPGIGKTALAVHWAHGLATSYPDGQLYVNLRGFDPRDAPLGATEALTRLVQSLSAPGDALPADVDAMSARYRTLLAGRRAIVMLDNAADDEQVRALLPGAPGCLTIVTSRSQLLGLIATGAATPVPLDVLTMQEARQLLARRLSPHRLAAASSSTVDELISHSGRLPLALAIVAAHAAAQPQMPLEVLVRQVKPGTFSGTDPATNLHHVFSLSYDRLSTSATTLFRLLHQHTSHDTGLGALSSLTASSPGDTQLAVDELVELNLVTPNSHRRYGLHDLIRSYSVAGPSISDAGVRLLDHYLHSAYLAAQAIQPSRAAIGLDAPAAGVVVEAAVDVHQAMAWFRAEDQNLTTTVTTSLTTGHPAHTWRLAWCVDFYLHRLGRWHESASCLQTALTACRMLGDQAALSLTLRSMARAVIRLGQLTQAVTYLQEAYELSQRLSDREGQANVHRHLAEVRRCQGDIGTALWHSQQFRDLSRDTGDDGSEGIALNNIAWYEALLGHHSESLKHARQSVELLTGSGDDDALGSAWDTLAMTQAKAGQLDDAATSYRHAVAVHVQNHALLWNADSLQELGAVYEQLGTHRQAWEAWSQAAAIYDELGHHSTSAQLRTKFDGQNYHLPSI